MEAAQRKLEVAAGNLANVETDGFGEHLLTATGRGSLHQTSAGGHLPLRPTGRQLDFAIAGDGVMYLAPRNRWGYNIARTLRVRSASFQRSADGTLHDEGGRALVGEHGVVRIPRDVAPAELEIRSDGSLFARGTRLDRIALPATGELRSGFLAGSNVNPIGEMIEILDAQRSFETAQKTLSAVDGARQKSVNDVGKIQ